MQHRRTDVWLLFGFIALSTHSLSPSAWVSNPRTSHASRRSGGGVQGRPSGPTDQMHRNQGFESGSCWVPRAAVPSAGAGHGPRWSRALQHPSCRCLQCPPRGASEASILFAHPQPRSPAPSGFVSHPAFLEYPFEYLFFEHPLRLKLTRVGV